ncbi:MAG: hypothetical protein EOO76_02860 [Novosphingobium sp.]|nr:MAG: hypothetical protein EOO76_02860 [Novosphingobium sp.]
MTNRKKSGATSKRANAKTTGTALALPSNDGTTLSALVPDSAFKVVPTALTPPESIFRDGRDVMVKGHAYVTREAAVQADEIYFVDEVTPSADGPWLGEADKIAWRDPSTGYECIMMRATVGGYLSGFVGIPPEHPLYGYEDDAIPLDLGIDVHGGLNYSETCQEGPSPDPRWVPKGGIASHSRRVCHGPPIPMVMVETKHATDYRVQHDNAWWLGFSCNHLYDLVPGEGRSQGGYLRQETGQVYRDDGYVLGEITFLAAQLRAIQDCEQLPKRIGDGPPPIGLDPHRGR